MADHGNQANFKRQSYFRLLKYAAPYKFRLILGILAGFLVAGSLFSGLMLVPKILKGVIPEARDKDGIHASASRIVDALEKGDEKSRNEKVSLVASELKPESQQDVAALVEKWKRQAARWGVPLPVDYYSNAIHVSKPIKFSIQVEDANGRTHWQFFSIFVFGFVFMWLIKNLATYANRYFTRWVGTRVVADLRNEVFESLLGQSLKFYGDIDVGHLISRCTNDTSAIESAVANTIADATRCPLEILACASVIVYFSAESGDYSLPIILFVGLPAAILPLIILGRRIRRVYRRAFARIAEVVSRMHEVFTCVLVVKAYNMEKEEVKRFKSVNRKYFRTVVSALKTELLMTPAMETVAVAATLVFLVYSYANGVSVVELGQLLLPAVLAYQPIKKVAKIRTYAERSMAAADRYFALLDTDTGIKEAENPIEIHGFEKDIRFENVSFSYGDKKILDGFNLTIEKGTVVAVVGETGSGKTTIAHLIARFYDVDSGRILVDGVDIREIKISSLRKLIGIVTQDPLLFNDTIANNIAYGRSDVSMDDIIQAAKAANAHEFIVSGRHPDGYDAVVGEKGATLSGGEKQRVAIARAMLKNSPIMILDEATSALDTVTERLVQDALDHLMRNRTVFAIAHRLSTVQHSDKIIVLQDGKIIESGKHDELMKVGGKYKVLRDMQFGAS